MDLFFSLENILFLAALGALSGLLAGLLGVGGGIVLVPGLYFGLSYLGLESNELMHVCVGTSLAIIVPTSMSSAFSHWRHSSVRADVLITLGIWVIGGATLGSLVAMLLDGKSLRLFFSLTLIFFAIVMCLDLSRFFSFEKGLRFPWSALSGSSIGAVSSLVGVGGATLSVPYMCACRVPVRQAVGTASALGVLLSIPAALGFVLIGLGVEGRPPLSLGYVNMLAWILVVPSAIIFAPIGAGIAHRMHVELLRFVFSAFMVVVATYMMMDVTNG